MAEKETEGAEGAKVSAMRLGIGGAATDEEGSVFALEEGAFNGMSAEHKKRLHAMNVMLATLHLKNEKMQQLLLKDGKTSAHHQPAHQQQHQGAEKVNVSASSGAGHTSLQFDSVQLVDGRLCPVVVCDDNTPLIWATSDLLKPPQKQAQKKNMGRDACRGEERWAEEEHQYSAPTGTAHAPQRRKFCPAPAGLDVKYRDL